MAKKLRASLCVLNLMRSVLVQPSRSLKIQANHVLRYLSDPLVDRAIFPILLDAYDQVDQYIKGCMENMSLPSFTAIVVYGNKMMWSKAYGKVDPTDPESPDLTIDNSMRIGSITKSFTAFMMYQLRDAGILTLDTKLTEFFPEFSMLSLYDNATDITLEELASHRSGLPRDLPCLSDDFTSEGCSDPAILKDLQNLYMLFPSYFTAYYSNLGFALLGRGLETQVNSTYEEYVHENIFKPLGMMDTHFHKSKLTQPLAYSVSIDEATGQITGRYNVSDYMGWATPMGGLFSTPRDMAKFTMFMLKNRTDDRIVSFDTFAESMVPTSFNQGDTVSFATPWESTFDQTNMLWNRGKNGFFEGYLSFMSVVKELNYGLFINTNCDNLEMLPMKDAIMAILSKAYSTVLCNETVEMNNLLVTPPGFQPPADDYQSLVGNYATTDYGGAEFSVKVTRNCSGIAGFPFCNPTIQLVATDAYNDTIVFVPFDITNPTRKVFRMVVDNSPNYGAYNFEMAYFTTTTTTSPTRTLFIIDSLFTATSTATTVLDDNKSLSF
eukprot:gene18349-21955_t